MPIKKRTGMTAFQAEKKSKHANMQLRRNSRHLVHVKTKEYGKLIFFMTLEMYQNFRREAIP